VGGVSGTDGRPVRSVDALFEDLRLGATTTTFLRKQVYGDSGNRYRHATAEDGWARRAYMLVVALVNILQRMQGIEEPAESQAIIDPDITNLISRAFNTDVMSG
jgi:hypothetical protein